MEGHPRQRLAQTGTILRISFHPYTRWEQNVFGFHASDHWQNVMQVTVPRSFRQSYSLVRSCQPTAAKFMSRLGFIPKALHLLIQPSPPQPRPPSHTAGTALNGNGQFPPEHIACVCVMALTSSIQNTLQACAQRQCPAPCHGKVMADTAQLPHQGNQHPDMFEKCFKRWTNV